jgi:hypothetical protein
MPVRERRAYKHLVLWRQTATDSARRFRADYSGLTNGSAN